MSSITTIQATDLITNSRADINNNFSNLNTDKIETSVLDTDTTLAANSDSKVATQKAIKAYVDGVGVANASTTVRGLVEEALDAEVVAGTDTGATGARLFVPPSKLNTQIDAKLASYIPAFQQSIGVSPLETPSAGEFAIGSIQDGSVIYATVQGATDNLYRFERDNLSGQFLKTHSATISAAGDLAAGTNGSIIVIGNYIYLFSVPTAGGNIYCYRYDAATLLNETVMTVPAITANNVMAWTDGTNAYIVSSLSNTTGRLWTLSGTTFTASTTAVISNPFASLSVAYSTFWDGTNAFICGADGGEVYTIKKLTVIDGSSSSSTSKKIPTLSDVQVAALACSIDDGRMYIGGFALTYSDALSVSSQMFLLPITKP